HTHTHTLVFYKCRPEALARKNALRALREALFSLHTHTHTSSCIDTHPEIRTLIHTQKSHTPHVTHHTHTHTLLSNMTLSYYTHTHRTLPRHPHTHIPFQPTTRTHCSPQNAPPPHPPNTRTRPRTHTHTHTHRHRHIQMS